jgi:hypothetical protein
MKRLATTTLFAVAATLALASPASAEVGLKTFDVTFSGPSGAGVSQAGSHPFSMSTAFDVNTVEIPEGIASDEGVKDLEIAQIEGFVGDQTSVPRCSSDDFLTPVTSNATDCPDSSAVGMVEIEIGLKGGFETQEAPVYFLDPAPGKVAKLGFNILEVPITTDIGLSQSPPYNLVASTRYVSQAIEFFGAKLTLWGNPADPAHDPERGRCYNTPASCPAGISEIPLLTMPRSCKGPLESEWEVDSWQHPGAWVKGFAETHDDAIPPKPQGMGGCGKLGFSPQVSAQPTSTQAESASGLDFSIDVADEGLKNPEGIAQADIAKIFTAFPAGMTLNPSAAEGLGVCSRTRYAAESLTATPEQGCPEASKLGTIEAHTPLLEDHALHGEIYLAEQDDPATTTPGAENPFDSFAAVYLIVRDPGLGIFVKLAGEVRTDEKTGQVLTSFKDLPAFPLSRVDVHLRSGPRAPFITPPDCGTYATETMLTPSSGAAPLPTASSFTLGSGPGGAPCPAGGVPPFDPSFEAGSENNAAGAYSPFVMRLRRSDGEQDLTRFSATLPPGVAGRLAGLSRCPDAQLVAAKAKSGRKELASPSCPGSSRVGSALAGAGVGTALTYVPGSLYLAGPYHGAPLSVAAIVPAVAGPFDVGTVVTRVALRLNPITARVEVDGAASDPIPHILDGIPLKVRDIRVFADRGGFTLNPTSCEPSAAAAQIFGSFADPFNPADDVAVARDSRYQASSCASLAFGPKLSLALKGGTRRSDHPALRAVLTPRPGDANLAGAVVTLPHSAFLDQAHIRTICTRVQFAAGPGGGAGCPAGSVYGHATAWSPLLDEPAQGPVYLRSSNHNLPDLVMALQGPPSAPVSVEVAGRIDSKGGGIRSSFETIPDLPVSRFVLDMQGAKKGLIVNSRNLCARVSRADVRLAGQNGRQANSKPAVAAAGCGKPKVKKGQR